jgi:cytochrome c oxidase assembly factor CtaG
VNIKDLKYTYNLEKKRSTGDFAASWEFDLPIYVLMLVTLVFVIRKFKKGNLIARWQNPQVQKFKKKQML